MTFEEFLAQCGSARSVLTTDGTALLIGDYVIECRGMDSSITSYIAKALQLIPSEPELEPIDA